MRTGHERRHSYFKIDLFLTKTQNAILVSLLFAAGFHVTLHLSELKSVKLDPMSGIAAKMRSLVVSGISFLMTGAVIGNAYYQKKQFYPSVVYITKSNPSMAVSLPS